MHVVVVLLGVIGELEGVHPQLLCQLLEFSVDNKANNNKSCVVEILPLLDNKKNKPINAILEFIYKFSIFYIIF